MNGDAADQCHGTFCPDILLSVKQLLSSIMSEKLKYMLQPVSPCVNQE